MWAKRHELLSLSDWSSSWGFCRWFVLSSWGEGRDFFEGDLQGSDSVGRGARTRKGSWRPPGGRRSSSKNFPVFQREKECFYRVPGKERRELGCTEKEKKKRDVAYPS